MIFEEQGEVVAYALFREQTDEIYLRQLFVVRDRRRKGIGRHALGTLRSEVWSKTKRLTVEVRNEAGMAFSDSQQATRVERIVLAREGKRTTVWPNHGEHRDECTDVATKLRRP